MVAFLPALLELGGSIYALSAIVAGSILLSLALAVHRVREGRAADRAARRLFAYSIVYLFVLFAVLLLEAAFGRYLSLSGVSLA
jgi:heme o synthase